MTADEQIKRIAEDVRAEELHLTSNECKRIVRRVRDELLKDAVAELNKNEC